MLKFDGQHETEINVAAEFSIIFLLIFSSIHSLD